MKSLQPWISPMLRLYDNTRLEAFRRCPRYYFYRHVMHWRLDNHNAPLAFGGSWHAAMDAIWDCISRGKAEKESVETAIQGFLSHWRSLGMPDEDLLDDEEKDFLKPRLPSTAIEMLWEYYSKRYKFIQRAEVLDIEHSFAVPLSADDPTLFYVGRIDKFIKPDPNRIRGIEHKTTTAVGKGYKIKGLFRESFSPNSQVDGYLYTLRLLTDLPYVDVWVDAALVNSNGQDFTFIPVDRVGNMLDSWLFTTHWWIGKIEEEMIALQQDSGNDPYMRAFPQDTRSCFDFNTACPYLGLCKSRANPLAFGDEVPRGYTRDKWDPLDHVGTPKELL